MRNQRVLCRIFDNWELFLYIVLYCISIISTMLQHGKY